MTLRKRPNSGTYNYDFSIDGTRYTGSTWTGNKDEALAFEKAIKDEILPMRGFCRAILRKAMLETPKNASSRRGRIYVLKSGYFIKIGYSKDPHDRLKTINTAIPGECELLFSIPGSIKLERRVHDLFRPCHYQKEWFFLCGKLKRFIEEAENHLKCKRDASTPAESTPDTRPKPLTEQHESGSI
jgi:hypothetical protein